MQGETGEDLNKAGIQLQQDGRLAEAEAAFRRAMALNAKSSSVRCNLGSLLFSTGNREEALTLLESALELAPDSELAINNYGHALLELGRAAEALGVLERGIIYHRKSFLLGLSFASALLAVGQQERAELQLHELLERESENAAVWHGMGLACLGLGKLSEAKDAFLQAIRVESGEASYYYDLGNACIDLGQWVEAETAFQQVLSLSPKHVDAATNLGRVFLELGKLEEAEQIILSNNGLKEQHWQGFMNLGRLQFEKGEFQLSRESYTKASRIVPNQWEPWNCLGVVIHEMGDFEEAETHYNRALQISPGNPDVHWNLALTLLCLGDFTQGWREYEWRWMRTDFPSPRLDFEKPRWTGGPGRILLHTEQGLGDSLQFVRYASMAKRVCRGEVHLLAEPSLVSLFRLVEGIDSVLPKGTSVDAFPEVDYQLPLMSLSAVLDEGRSPRSFNAQYLKAPTNDIQAGKQVLDAIVNGNPRIGVVWEGNQQNRKGMKRSIPTAVFMDFLQSMPSHCAFFCLQPNRAGQETQLPNGVRICSFDHPPEDLAVTAGVIANLDLVVTVDTAVAHLSAALGIDTRLLLCSSPDWRWVNGGQADLWYPGMRIYKQRKYGDWSAPLKCLGVDLIHEIQSMLGHQ